MFRRHRVLSRRARHRQIFKMVLRGTLTLVLPLDLLQRSVQLHRCRLTTLLMKKMTIPSSGGPELEADPR
jgi:hypothetical protein